MKGTSFQNGIEFKITINGETWLQGEEISGHLEATAKNPGATLTRARVILAETTHRKLKSKSVEGFHILAEAEANTSPLNYSFKLPVQARITDNAGSLFMLYGCQDDLHTLGILKLNIVPHHYLRDLIELMRTEFRFALKTLTAGKNGWVVAKLEPSGSKDWAQLDNLELSLQISDDTIEAKFQFNRNAVDALKAGLQTKIEKREVYRSWDTPEFVHGFNDRLNKDAAQIGIENAISEYRQLGWLA
jgi:hypothetical protein